MKDLLDYIVKSLVTHPEAVEIEEENGENVVTFNLKTHPEDIGMIIGKAGQTIKAIRKILVVRALAENSQMGVFINIKED